MRTLVSLRFYTHELCKCRATFHPVLYVRFHSNLPNLNTSSHATELSELSLVVKTPSVMDELFLNFINGFPFSIGQYGSNSHSYEMVSASHFGYYIEASGYCVFCFLDRRGQNSDKPSTDGEI
jgi:hypothetical protein